MSADYTGLHGRDPYDTIPSHSHFVAEHWEDLNRGICPRCGRTVRWAGDESGWVRDDSLTVVVLTAEELRVTTAALDGSGRWDDKPLPEVRTLIERQADLNRPYQEAAP